MTEVAKALKAYTNAVADLRTELKKEVGQLRGGLTDSEGRSAKRFEAIEKAFAAMSEVVRTKQLVINDGNGRDRIALFVAEPNTHIIMFDPSKQRRTEVRADENGGFIEFVSGPQSTGVLQFHKGEGVKSIANK